MQNANNVRTAYVYDNRDRTTKVYLDSDKDGVPDTAEAQVAYLYANNRLSGIDTATTDYTLTYDAFGNVLTIKAGNYVLATYEYADNNGKLLKLTYGNGDYEEYVYDILERLVSVKLNGVTEYVVKYDSNGRLYSLTESGSTHIYEYDSLDRLIRAWQENASGTKVLEVENSYDDLGRPKGSTYVVNGKTMSYEVNYKANSNLVNYVMMPTAGLQSSISYTYDEFERVTKKQNAFSSALNFYEQYGYYSYTDANDVEHATSLVSSVTFGGNSSYTTPATYTYVYDNLGNITQIKKDGSIISSYTYDSLGQLTSEIDSNNGYRYSYTYDKSGNITAKTTYNLATLAVISTVNYTYGNTTWGDLLTSYNGTSITYDAIGNPTKWRNAAGLTWDARELQRADLATNSYVNYTYNSDGIRTSRSYVDANIKYNETRNYVLDGSKIIQESIRISTISSTTNATLYYLYDESGSVQGFIYNNAYYYFQKNLQGDVIRILNDYGTVVVEYTYDAWGKVLTTTGTLASTVGKYNSFRYRSYYYDTETGYYYLQSRYYDPTVGRFLNADGIIGANGGIEGYNMFAYCNNNPVMYCDPSGYALHIVTQTLVNEGVSQIKLGSESVKSYKDYDIIIYYSHEKSDKNFDEQASNSPYVGSDCLTFAVGTNDEFLSAMNEISELGEVRRIYIYMHSSKEGLELYNETFNDFESLPIIHCERISLFACKAGHWAKEFAIATHSDVLACNYSVSFSRINSYLARASYAAYFSNVFNKNSMWVLFDYDMGNIYVHNLTGITIFP